VTGRTYDDDVCFGYRRSLFGPPTCFKGMRPVRGFHSGDDPYFPFTQYFKLSPEQIGLSLDELCALYPYQRAEP
jgi:hypothetical protein